MESNVNSRAMRGMRANRVRKTTRRWTGSARRRQPQQRPRRSSLQAPQTVVDCHGLPLLGWSWAWCLQVCVEKHVVPFLCRLLFMWTIAPARVFTTRTVLVVAILAVVLVRRRRSKNKLLVAVRRSTSLEPSVPATPATPITPCPFGDASSFARDPMPQSRFAMVAEQMTEMSSEDACGSVTGTEHESLYSEPRP